MRIVLLSCAGAPLPGEVMEYIRSRDRRVLDEIVGVVLSRPRRRDSTAGPAGSVSGAAPLVEAIRWRYNNLLVAGGLFMRHAVSRFTHVAYRRIEDFCLERGLEPHVTDNVNGEAACAAIRAMAPDLVVIITFHHLLKRHVIDIARLATLNVHCSLLPSYRGADPINAALRDGVEETGVTVHWVDEGMDTGEVLLQRPVKIGRDRSEERLRPRLARAAGELLLEAIEQARCGVLGRHSRPHQWSS